MMDPSEYWEIGTEIRRQLERVSPDSEAAQALRPVAEKIAGIYARTSRFSDEGRAQFMRVCGLLAP